MVIEKQIKRLNIQAGYMPFVKAFVSSIVNAFKDTINSIHICGSIPKGTAKPYKSDADFTLVSRVKLIKTDHALLDEIKESLLSEFPFITKIDTPYCVVGNVLNQPYEWGFWIKIISFCIYGEDPGKQLPPLVPSSDLISGLNSDTNEMIDRHINDLKTVIHLEKRNLIYKKITRRLIRALFSLTIVKEGLWSDDLETSKRLLIKNFPDKEEMIQILFHLYHNPSMELNRFISTAREIKKWFNQQL